MHRAAYHFIKTLHISSFTKTMAVEAENGDQPEGDDEDDNIDMSNKNEASSDDVAAMASTAMTDFEPEDVLGNLKVLAFVNQVCMSSEGVHAYLEHICTIHQLKPIKLRL